jgi:hypothetical protein
MVSPGVVGFCGTHIHIPNKTSVMTQRLSTLLLPPRANRLPRASQQYVDSHSGIAIRLYIARRIRLSISPFTGQYSIDTNNRILNAKVSRANAADFMIRIAAQQ